MVWEIIRRLLVNFRMVPAPPCIREKANIEGTHRQVFVSSPVGQLPKATAPDWTVYGANRID